MVFDESVEVLKSVSDRNCSIYPLYCRRVPEGRGEMGSFWDIDDFPWTLGAEGFIDQLTDFWIKDWMSHWSSPRFRGRFRQYLHHKAGLL